MLSDLEKMTLNEGRMFKALDWAAPMSLNRVRAELATGGVPEEYESSLAEVVESIDTVVGAASMRTLCELVADEYRRKLKRAN